MMKWEAWVHVDAGKNYVMVRNHKTSRALCSFAHREHADMQARKINRYPWQRIAELYKQAIASDILVLHHEEMSFKSTKLKTVDIEKGEGCYALIVWCDGRKVIFKKEKYKKDIVDYLRRVRLEHTDEDIVATVRQKLQARKAVR